MKKGMMARMRSRWWWVIATALLLSCNFVIACGSDSPTESRKIENAEKEQPDDKE